MDLIQLISLVLLVIVIVALANRNRLGFANQPRQKRTKSPPIECEVCGTIFDSTSEYLAHQCPNKTDE